MKTKEKEVDMQSQDLKLYINDESIYIDISITKCLTVYSKTVSKENTCLCFDINNKNLFSTNKRESVFPNELISH